MFNISIYATSYPNDGDAPRVSRFHHGYEILSTALSRLRLPSRGPGYSDYYISIVIGHLDDIYQIMRANAIARH
jgi:hypothetical protein